MLTPFLSAAQQQCGARGERRERRERSERREERGDALIARETLPTQRRGRKAAGHRGEAKSSR